MKDRIATQQAMAVLIKGLSSKREAFRTSDYHTSLDALDELLGTLLSIRVLANDIGNITVSNVMTDEIVRLTRTEPTLEEKLMFVAVGAA